MISQARQVGLLLLLLSGLNIRVKLLHEDVLVHVWAFDVKTLKD